MRKLLIINVSANTGSTGRIAEEIGVQAMAFGYESYFAYGRVNNNSRIKTIPIGSARDVLFHGLQSLLLDNHGFGSRVATEALVKKIIEITPDIINLHNIHGYYLNVEILFECLAKTNIPVVWTLHDCWPFTGHCSHYMRLGCEKWKTHCERCQNSTRYPKSLFLDRSAQNFARKKTLFTTLTNLTIVTPCHWLEEEVKQSFLGSYPVHMINNGIDIGVFKPVDCSVLRNQYHIHLQNKVILGLTSEWSQIKGLADFFWLRQNLDSTYKIILVGLSKKQLANLPDGVIGVQRTETMHQLAEFYSLADVYVNPTYVDNFPNTNLEALACGTPIVTYRTGGSPEAVEKHTGLVVEKGDLQALKDAVIELSGKKNEMAISCRTRAIEHFNKQNRINDYITLFDNVIK